jgi:hypothetical protein
MPGANKIMMGDEGGWLTYRRQRGDSRAQLFAAWLIEIRRLMRWQENERRTRTGRLAPRRTLRSARCATSASDKQKRRLPEGKRRFV